MFKFNLYQYLELASTQTEVVVLVLDLRITSINIMTDTLKISFWGLSMSHSPCFFSQELCRIWTEPLLSVAKPDDLPARRWCREAFYGDWRAKTMKRELTLRKQLHSGVNLLGSRLCFLIHMQLCATKCSQRWSINCATLKYPRHSNWWDDMLPEHLFFPPDDWGQ